MPWKCEDCFHKAEKTNQAMKRKLWKQLHNSIICSCCQHRCAGIWKILLKNVLYTIYCCWLADCERIKYLLHCCLRAAYAGKEKKTALLQSFSGTSVEDVLRETVPHWLNIWRRECVWSAFRLQKSWGVLFQPIIAIANVPNVWSSSLYCLQLYHKSRLFAIDSDVFLKKYEWIFFGRFLCINWFETNDGIFYKEDTVCPLCEL